MTDMNASADFSAASDMSAPVSNTTAEAPVTPASEKLFTQSELNSIVGREKVAAREKSKQEALAELRQSMASQPEQQYAQNQMPNANIAQQSLGGMPAVSEQMIRQLASQEVQRLVENANAERFVKDFYTKIDAAQDEYPGLKESLNDMNLVKNSHIVMMANGFENTAAIMDELRNNPAKMELISSIFNNQSPANAHKEMQKLAQSIKANKEAELAPSAKAPLSQIKPSPVGTDGGKMTVSDYRKADWLKV
jgi:hypothetical protein